MSTSSTNGWTRCPPGSFGRLAANLTARRQRQLRLTRVTWAVGTALALAASVGGATAIELYIFHHRSKPAAGGCPPYPVPSVQPSNPITPPAAAPPQTGGGC
jgi:hypothetical protein